ncbi:SLIT-ROBO Rho GTPase-activating protein 3 [Larimichthys crocea]|uniref:Uncharacterized protein n=1 Tax=Larimichthys crocea TaxID=215358 RepID=A0ACD3RB64_LARCR|nr:SLIT-ROBO Rho GTPase-activating protein 3 [Larimichthys crocea]
MMTSHVKLRKEKGSLAEYESQMKDLRAQLTDQIKILDSQVEVKQQQLSDLSEFLRRRGDIEAEYARALDKLTERFTHKTKKKEQWGQSVCQVWTVLLSQTRLESREHAALGDTCCNTLTQRLTHSTEDTHRLHKRSKEVGIQMQDELLKVTTELQTRHGRVQETQLKCTKARNDYLLNLAAANAAMNKYYLQDVSTLIDCCDLGFHLSMERVMKCYLASRWRIQKTEETGLKQLETAVTSLDQSGDRDALLQQHDAAFCLPFRFNYHPHEGDQVCEVSAESQVRYELETRFQQLQSRLAAVTLETEEVSKTLKATLTALLDTMCESDSNPSPDVPSSLSHEPPGGNAAPKLTLAKRRANQQETETYYFTPRRSTVTLPGEEGECLGPRYQTTSVTTSVLHVDQWAVFTVTRAVATIDAPESSGQQIPVVVESCIRFINLHGLHHEGIFRVPGSQREVNLIRDAFERGDDPLSDSECDLDSVAEIEAVTEKAVQIKTIVSTFPRPLLIVLRYLFAFLNHLLRGLDSDDAVARQPQVNDLVKTMILQHDIIFPGQSELPGPVYEKHMTLEQEYCEPITEEGDGETEHLPSEDEWEAVAMFDYVARSPAELSFKMGEILILHSKASCDWWRGEVGGVKGLIPHKYISVLEGSQERRHTLDNVRQGGFKPPDRPPFGQAERTPVDKEMISRQMNSVFKELLSRQPPVQQSALTTPAAPAPSSSSSSSSTSSPLPQTAPAAKKAGFGLRGRALFRPVD